MKLKKLKFVDFRQFSGENVVKFSNSENQKLTIIHGMNGYGKSTIMNIIYYTLYGEFQKGFENGESRYSFLSQKSISNNISKTLSSLQFEFEGKDYLIERSVKYKFSSNGKIDLERESKLYHIEENGHHQVLSNLERVINRAIPKEMADQFIFDGESRAKQLAQSSSKNIKNAIKDIIGSSNLETTISALYKIKNSITHDIQQKTGDSNIGLLQTSLESFENQEIEYKKNIEICNDEIQKIESEIEDLIDRTADHKLAKRILNQEKLAKNKIKQIKTERIKAVDNKHEKFNSCRNTILTIKLVNDIADLIDDPKIERKLPGDVNKPFILDLLKSKKCICNRDITEGSDAEKSIRSMLSEAGERRVVEIGLRIKSAMTNYEETYKERRNTILEADSQIAFLDEEINVQERLIEDSIESLKKIENLEGLDDLQAKRINLTKDRDKLKKAKLKLKQNLYETIVPDKKDVEARLKNALAAQPLTKMNRKALIVLDKLISLMEHELVNEEEKARNAMMESIKNAVTKMHRGYTPNLDENFVLKLINKEHNVELAKSTGEGQLLTLAFTGALISYCARRTQSQNSLFVPGTVAPLILDSPFGQLDSEYGRIVCSILPELAEQVILLVSDTQARHINDSGILNKVGINHTIQIGRGIDDNEAKHYKIGNVTYSAFTEELSPSEARVLEVS